MTMPIEPGSDLDKALDLFARRVEGLDPPQVGPHTDGIDVHSAHHLLAIGIRVNTLRAGLTYEQLPPVIQATWYGQFPDGPLYQLYAEETERLFG